jgi:hypothetical protein
MRKLLTCLAVLCALLLSALPAAAHHGRGSHDDSNKNRGGDWWESRSSSNENGGDDWWEARNSEKNGGDWWEGRGGFAGCDWRFNPASCPGNSGWAHWCKFEHGPERGACVASFARGLGFELISQVFDDDNDNNQNDDNDNEQGDLRITDIDVNDNGSFRVRGEGAEGSVLVSVGGVFSRVLGFGQGEADGDGDFDIEGSWGCVNDDDSYDARLRAQDGDERDVEIANFPCDETD